MIIGSCGYGATGSSVLTDLLHEFDDVQVFDKFEFTLAYRVDGLQDLEYHLMKQYAKNLSGDYAIKRFLYQAKCFLTPFINKPCNGKVFYDLSSRFVEEITQIKYRGMDTADVLSGNIIRNFFALASKKILMPHIVEKIVKRPSFLWPCRDMYYSVKPENFYESARNYTNSILISMGADISKPICLDQPFEGNAPEHSFPFYDDPYAVVIDRDPRDLYISNKYTMQKDSKFYPRSNVNDFIIFYRTIREEITEHQKVLRMRFEDFIYEYDNSVSKVKKFFNISKHRYPKTHFIPENSINNTQLVRRHPDDIEDINKIQYELSEFLYPFENYKDVIINGTPFSGAGRKMTTEKSL
jgi:hypothetical protein